MKEIILLLITSAGLISCGDEYISYKLYMDNQTNDTINISFTSKNHTIVCLPHSVSLIYGTEGRVVSNFECNPQLFKNSKSEIKITTNTGKILKKDIFNNNNWECSGDKKKGWDMIFVITENDLE
jgi:hypothetical protein